MSADFILTVSEPAFQVIARRWRPRTFAEMVGQQHIVRTLTNAIKTGRVAHAYLFVGPRGTGKTTTARIFAKALSCTGGPKADFDLKDPVCVEIDRGSCLDVIEIDAASNRRLEDAERIREACQFQPSGRFKIFIVDEAHQLTKEAFNALLKTIEEPPPWVKFVFATTEADKVLDTIVSRCQRLEFQPIPENLIAERLAEIVKADGVKAERDALIAIARLAHGGMRDSQSILDQVISFAGKNVTEKDVLDIYGLASVKQITDLSQAMAAGNAAAALALSDKFHEEGRDLLRILADLQVMVRGAVLDAVKNAGKSRVLATELSSDQLVRMLDVLQSAEGSIRHGLSPRAAFEVALLKAVDQTRQRSIDGLIKDLAGSASGLPKEPGQKKISTTPTVPEVNAVAVPKVEKATKVTKPVIRDEPPLDVASAEAEASAQDSFDASALLSQSQSEEVVKPGSKEFSDAVESIPDSVRAKLKDALGAEFSQLRSLPPGKLRRPR